MTTLKTLSLSVGFGIVFAGAVCASERDRSDAAGTSGREATGVVANTQSSVASVNDIKRIAPGVGMVKRNGVMVQIKAANAITPEEVVSERSAAQRHEFDEAMRGVPSVVNAKGATIYASQIVGAYPDLMGDQQGQAQKSDTPQNVEEAKKVWPWMEVTRNGVKVLVFASPVVFADPSVRQNVPPSAQHAANVPSVERNGKRVFADMAVYPGENEVASQLPSGQ